MKLHELSAPAGSRRPRKRLGRGISQGQGKTCGHGQKGQFARTSHLPVGFEGGQMPLAQRLPKLRGFHNRFRKQYASINLGKLNRFEAGSTVDIEALKAAGLIGSGDHGVKILNSGALK
ncbi:MAG: 50S ribosomal protein L15, partial [Candidatus Dormibacteraeota bacterium]|nr:50S ribosomal protein L15 [Candidatus Dormibacteraeota bacterium]